MENSLCDELLIEIFRRLPPPYSAAVSLVSKRWLNLHRSSVSHLSLRLSPNHRHTLLSLSSFLSRFPFLSSLSLSADSLSLSPLVSAAATCRGLRRLRLVSRPVEIGSIADCCPLLVSLTVSVSNAFDVRALAGFGGLKEVSLNFAFFDSGGENPEFDFPLFGSSAESSGFDFPQLGTSAENRGFNYARINSSAESPNLNSAQFNLSTEKPDFNSAQFNLSTEKRDYNSAHFDSSAEKHNLNHARIDSSAESPNLNSAQFNSSTEKRDFNSAQFNSSTEKRDFNSAQFNSSAENREFNSAQLNSSTEKRGFNSAQFNSSAENPNFNLGRGNQNSSSAQFNSRSKGSSFDVELQLETLTLSCIRNGDYGLNWLYRSCKKLKKLKFRACEGIGDNPSSSAFISCIKNVQEVELRTCRMIIDVVLLKLAENSKLLKTLLVYDGGCREGLLRFIERSECDLQKLDLRLPLDLDNRHLSAVAEKFRGLTSLRLQSCCLVTGEGLKAICLSKRNGLEELALINCDVAEREPGLLTTLAQCLKGLKKLDLSYNEMLVDKEFVSMIVSCGELKELRLRGCRGLSSLALVSISKYCKNLELVDIMFCCGIEAKDIELFVSNSPRLRQLIVEENKLPEKVQIRVWN